MRANKYLHHPKMGCLKLSYYTRKEALEVNANFFGNTLEKNAPSEKNRVSWYRYGFNGMERDDEVKGAGNSLDFGARVYDSRLGRWLTTDPEFMKQPSWSTYKSFLNNPILYMDPDGNTEYYFGGKWIGTDGKNNGLLVKVRDNDLKKEIVQNTRKGLNYVKSPPAMDFGVGAISLNEMLVMNYDLLHRSNEKLIIQFSEKGRKGEYGATYCQDENGCFNPTVERYFSGDKGTLPRGSDVSLHGHPTGLDEKGRPVRADQPTPEDKDFFTFQETNIIVGNNGNAGPVLRTNPNGEYEDQGYLDDPAINFYDTNTDLKGTVSGKEAKTMLSGDRGKLGKVFERKNKKANSND